MPLLYPFRTAFDDVSIVESVLVQLSSNGFAGWGESACWGRPAYSSEWSASQFMVSRDFIAPLLLNQDVSSGVDLQNRVKGIKGNYFAKAAFDLAWWDLYAKQQCQPLWKILGGETPSVDVGADFGIMENIESLLTAISEAKGQGYKRVKLKYRPGWELDMVKAVRKRFPDMLIHIDCNSHYSLKDIEMFRELDKYHLTMIEQPLAHDDIIDHAVLQGQLKTPICLDESITSVDKARKALEIGACGFVNIKLGRVGGITNALKINKVCEEHNIPCWVGGMLESSVGSSHNIAFATLSNVRYPSDIFPTSRFYRRDLGQNAIVHSAPSQFMPASAHGIGTIPDEAFLEKMTIEQVLM